MAIASGTRLGPYEIVALIGTGGMGEVYRARDIRLGRMVAIKVIAEGWSTHPDARRRFEQEAVAISRLDHRHICSLFDIGHQDSVDGVDGVDFLVMPLLDGVPLDERLLSGPLPLGEALDIAMQIGDALDKAHRAGIVHRDLKPGNVMMTADGVKLLDFGLSYSVGTMMVADPDRTGTTTTRRVAMGTPRYMAPEQVAGRGGDTRTDIFAFGELVYEMVAGVRAFRTDPAGTIVFDREPEPLSARNPEALPPLDRAIAKCLAVDPDARWQTMRDLLDELKWIATLPRDRSAAHRPSALRSSTGALASAGAVAVALITFAVWNSSGSRRLDPTPSIRFALRPAPGSPMGDFAVAPDGRRIVFVQTSDRTALLWTRALDEPEARMLPDTTGARDPFWSPDGRSIAFFADGRLKRVPASGGPVQALCDAPEARGGSWGAGVIVFAPNIVGPLMKVADTGGTPVGVTELDAARQEDSHRKPYFLPDGRRFLFIARSRAQALTGVDIASVDGAPRTRLLDVESATSYVAPGFVLYLRDGTQGALMALPFDARAGRATGPPVLADPQLTTDLTAFSVGLGLLAYAAASANHFAWFDRQGQLLGEATPPGRYGGVALSPDGTRAVVRRVFQGNADLWMSDLVRGTMSRLTSDAAVEDDPVWAPDGRRLAYSSARENGSTMFVTDTTAATEERLLESNMAPAPADWSSDGRTLIFVQHDPSTLSDIWSLSLADRKANPVVHTRFTEGQARLSPDGRWLAYESNETGRWEVYVRGFPEGEKRQVSVGGGAQPEWRRDGKELYYVDPHAMLMVAALRGASGALDAAPRPLFQTRLDDYAMASRYAVAPDAQRFLMNVRVEDTTADGIQVAAQWRVGSGQ